MEQIVQVITIVMINLTYRKYFYFLFSLVILMSCQIKYELTENLDPLETLYLNKNIKSVRVYDALDTMVTYDSILVNNQENIVHQMSYMNDEKIKYDTDNYPIRILQLADKPYNYKIEYEIVEDSLYQIWKPLKHYNWEYTANDLNVENQRSVIFKLSPNGKIEVEKNDDVIYNYYYNEKGQLTRKERVNAIDSRVIDKWNYYYNEESIEKASLIVQDSTVITHYFRGGLLNKTVESKVGFKIELKYDYEFY